MTPGVHARQQGVDDGEAQRLMLCISLSIAVPLWIEVVREMPPEQRAEVAAECGAIACYGNNEDSIGPQGVNRGRGNSGPERMTNGMPPKRPGDIARIFNATALGLAVLAFAPGGVDYLGMHWEAAE
jgi:hypothetical protein